MHQSRGRDLPTLTRFTHQHIWWHGRVSHEHFVKRRVAIHLLQRSRLHARLRHIQYKITEPRVFVRIPVRTREQYTPVSLVGAGRPHLLTVDNPLIAFEFGAGGQSSKVRATARLTE